MCPRSGRCGGGMAGRESARVRRRISRGSRLGHPKVRRTARDEHQQRASKYNFETTDLAETEPRVFAVVFKTDDLVRQR